MFFIIFLDKCSLAAKLIYNHVVILIVTSLFMYKIVKLFVENKFFYSLYQKVKKQYEGEN